MVKVKLKRPEESPNRVFIYEFLAIGLLLVIILASSCQRMQGSVQELWLGVETIKIDPALSTQYNIRSSNGLLVSRTFVGSPADRAGLQAGDIIQRWNGVSVTSQRQITRLIKNSNVNQRITLSVSRNEQPVLIYVMLGVRPSINRM